MIHSLRGAAIRGGTLCGRRCEAQLQRWQRRGGLHGRRKHVEEFVICVKRGKKKPVKRKPGLDSGRAGSRVSIQLSTHLPHH